MARAGLFAVFLAGFAPAPWADDGHRQVLASADEPVAPLAGSLVFSLGGSSTTDAQARAAALAALTGTFNVSSGVLGVFMVDVSGPRRLGSTCTAGLPTGPGVDASGCYGKQRGETCTVQCKAGYASASGGESIVTCGDKGVFNSSGLQCRPVFCPNGSSLPLLASPALEDTCDDVTVGHSCFVFCARGYTLSGPPTELVCSSQLDTPGVGTYLAVWGKSATTLPNCTARRCSLNIPLRLGVVHDCMGKATGQTCTASSAPGFVYAGGSGPTTLTCGQDGAFHGLLPDVSPTSCGVLPAAAGTAHTCKAKAVNTFCWAYCRRPYRGSLAQYRCSLVDGRPQYVPTRAGVSCACSGPGCPRRLSASPSSGCDASAVLRGLDAEGLSHDCLDRRDGESCTAACAEGYAAQGRAANYTCRAGALVGASPPKCVPEVCRSGLPSGEGVEHDCEGRRTGSTCTARCGAGYGYRAGSAEQELTCTASGAFAGTSPVCRPLPCEALALPAAHFAHDCAGARTGDGCEVRCAAPLIGLPARLHCGASGALEGTLPRCRAAAPDAAALAAAGERAQAAAVAAAAAVPWQGWAAPGSLPGVHRLAFVMCAASGRLAGVQHLAEAASQEGSEFLARLGRALLQAGAAEVVPAPGLALRAVLMGSSDRICRPLHPQPAEAAVVQGASGEGGVWV